MTVLSNYPRVLRSLECLCEDNGGFVVRSAIVPGEWLQAIEAAERELAGLTADEIETLAMGDDQEREPIIVRAPAANSILVASFDAGELATVFRTFEAGRMAENRTCATCRFWSPWLPGLGDCMAYAFKRQDAMIVARDPSEIPPLKSARETEPHETCNQWAAPDAPEEETK